MKLIDSILFLRQMATFIENYVADQRIDQLQKLFDTYYPEIVPVIVLEEPLILDKLREMLDTAMIDTIYVNPLSFKFNGVENLSKRDDPLNNSYVVYNVEYQGSHLRLIAGARDTAEKLLAYFDEAAHAADVTLSCGIDESAALFRELNVGLSHALKHAVNIPMPRTYIFPTQPKL